MDEIRDAVSQGHLWGCCSLGFSEETLLFHIAAFFPSSVLEYSAVVMEIRVFIVSKIYSGKMEASQRLRFWKT
jgi:hypothetical protein